MPRLGCSLPCLDQVCALCGRDGLPAGACVELSEYGRDVVVDGAPREEESLGDLSVPETVRDQHSVLGLCGWSAHGALASRTSGPSRNAADTVLA